MGAIARAGNCSQHQDVPETVTLSWLVMAAICFGVSLKFVLQCYLAYSNLTFYEVVKRRRIWYLNFDPALGSPFSSSPWYNLVSYCCTFEVVGVLHRIPSVAAISKAFAATCPGDLRRSRWGRTADSGEMVWRVGEPHSPFPLETRCCSCYCNKHPRGMLPVIVCWGTDGPKKVRHVPVKPDPAELAEMPVPEVFVM